MLLKIYLWCIREAQKDEYTFSVNSYFDLSHQKMFWFHINTTISFAMFLSTTKVKVRPTISVGNLAL